MEKKYNYTYQIKNLINGKTYIGVHSTDSLNDDYMGSGKQLKPAFKKYGKENFFKIILCFFDTVNEAYEEEKFLVNEEWIKSKDNYNIAIGGNGGDFGDEVRKKISLANSGKNNGMYGKKISEKTREKLQKKLSGKNNPNYGKQHSQETKNKIREKALGRTPSEETRKKMSKNNVRYWEGKSLLNETKIKISQSKKGIIPVNKGKSKYDDIECLVKIDIKNGFTEKMLKKKYNISSGGIHRLKQKLKLCQ
jgi:group I intron endonuclease